MAKSTAKTYLMYSTDSGSTYVALVPIMNYPDMGSTPATIDTTDLSATVQKTSIQGLQDIADLVFEANYDKTLYATIAALDGEQFLQLQFGAAGVDGTFTWQGDVSIFTSAGGVDEARKMQITCSASTEIIAA